MILSRIRLTGSVSSIGFASWRVGLASGPGEWAWRPFQQTPDPAFLSNRAGSGENLGTDAARRAGAPGSVALRRPARPHRRQIMPKPLSLLLFAALASAGALSSAADNVFAQ